MTNSIKESLDAKKIFRKCGTCSQTFGHLLNREFGHPNTEAEKALDPLAGGILNTGHQCGMLWGTSLAIGAEAFRRYPDINQATASAVTATQHIIESFKNRSKTLNCREIIGYDLDSVIGLVKFGLKTMIKGMNNSQCFNLAEVWAPEAIQAAQESLSNEPINLEQKPISCASIVAKEMGATDEEQVMMAGFAGGLGLSGHACGALSAAIWIKNLDWCKEHPGKTPSFFINKQAKKIMQQFQEEVGEEMLCEEITKHKFESIDDHSKYIQNGGCEKLINALTQ